MAPERDRIQTLDVLRGTAVIPLSAWWLSRYRIGPVEWIWRRLTCARPL